MHYLIDTNFSAAGTKRTCFQSLTRLSTPCGTCAAFFVSSNVELMFDEMEPDIVTSSSQFNLLKRILAHSSEFAADRFSPEEDREEAELKKILPLLFLGRKGDRSVSREALSQTCGDFVHTNDLFIGSHSVTTATRSKPIGRSLKY